jgi:hypothetical protein
MKNILPVLAIIALISPCVFAESGSPQVTPDELTIERPTLISLGFEWQVSGDDNGNASCLVQYRKQGQSEWREYLPLFRIGLGQKIYNAMATKDWFYTIPDALAGSIMDLEPGTLYEVKLTLQDPDPPQRRNRQPCRRRM